MSYLKYIYFTTVILLTCALIGIYFYKNQEYNHELEKIERLEIQQEENDKELEKIREKTTPCPVSGLNSPRTCYFQSKYRCSWNIKAGRCDKK